MAIPAQSRWWMATLVAVGLLVLISALALDQPDVVWAGVKPHCPSCRHQVRLYSHHCADCGAEYDWVVCPEEESPICADSLSVLQAEWLEQRIEALGPEEALKRVMQGTGLPREAADAYLHSVGRGDCGWCGGTKKDLASTEALEDADPCPACLGTGRCIECGGSRRARLGSQGAARALEAYRAELADLSQLDVPLSPEARLAETRRLAERFLSQHAGSVEARELLFPGSTSTVTAVCRVRLAKVIRALRVDN